MGPGFRKSSTLGYSSFAPSRDSEMTLQRCLIPGYHHLYPNPNEEFLCPQSAKLNQNFYMLIKFNRKECKGCQAIVCSDMSVPCG
jgi:hypothetical protein